MGQLESVLPVLTKNQTKTMLILYQICDEMRAEKAESNTRLHKCDFNKQVFNTLGFKFLQASSKIMLNNRPTQG
jgi:hypothetical protein